MSDTHNPTTSEYQTRTTPQRRQPRRLGYSSINTSQSGDSPATGNHWAPSPPHTDGGEHASNSTGSAPQGRTVLPDSRLGGEPQGPENCRSVSEQRDLPTGAAFVGRRPLNPSEAAEDSLAYAEALEGGNDRGNGCVPFYPGMALLHPSFQSHRVGSACNASYN